MSFCEITIDFLLKNITAENVFFYIYLVNMIAGK